MRGARAAAPYAYRRTESDPLRHAGPRLPRHRRRTRHCVRAAGLGTVDPRRCRSSRRAARREAAEDLGAQSRRRGSDARSVVSRVQRNQDLRGTRPPLAGGDQPLDDLADLHRGHRRDTGRRAPGGPRPAPTSRTFGPLPSEAFTECGQSWDHLVLALAPAERVTKARSAHVVASAEATAGQPSPATSDHPQPSATAPRPRCDTAVRHRSAHG